MEETENQRAQKEKRRGYDDEPLKRKCSSNSDSKCGERRTFRKKLESVPSDTDCEEKKRLKPIIKSLQLMETAPNEISPHYR